MPLLIKYITSIIPTPGNACKVHFFKYICLPIESVIKVAVFVSEITRNYAVTDVTCLAKRNAKIILSAILPRPVDFNQTKIFVVAVNSLLRNLCLHRGADFIATYKPFVKYGQRQ
jgi:hypothetical protein